MKTEKINIRLKYDNIKSDNFIETFNALYDKNTDEKELKLIMNEFYQEIDITQIIKHLITEINECNITSPFLKYYLNYCDKNINILIYAFIEYMYYQKQENIKLYNENTILTDKIEKLQKQIESMYANFQYFSLQNTK